MLRSKLNLRIHVLMGNTQQWARLCIWSCVKLKGLLEIVSRNFWKGYESVWNGLSYIFSTCILQESGNVSLRATHINVTNLMNLWINWYPVESSFLALWEILNDNITQGNTCYISAITLLIFSSVLLCLLSVWLWCKMVKCNFSFVAFASILD